jgi:hypothetical protein
MQLRALAQQGNQKLKQGVKALVDNKLYKRTQKIVFGVSVLLVLSDLILPQLDFEGVSDLLARWAFDRGFTIAWAWGVLAGHLFIARKKPAGGLNEWIAIAILAGLTLSGLLLAFIFDIRGGFWLNLSLLIAGCLAGYILWPQSPPKAHGT